MEKTIRWGILGCGRIARKFAADLQRVSGSQLVAAGARSRHSVESFAEAFAVSHKHESYESLVADPDVDVIYVASPHGLHYEHVMLCLHAGKAVLCEKAFALNSAQAREMISLAQTRGIFLMEALWTKFLPHFTRMREMIQNGELGTIQSVLVNFGFIPQHPIPETAL